MALGNVTFLKGSSGDYGDGPSVQVFAWERETRQAVIVRLGFVLHGDRGHFLIRSFSYFYVLKNVPGDCQIGSLLGLTPQRFCLG